MRPCNPDNPKCRCRKCGDLRAELMIHEEQALIQYNLNKRNALLRAKRKQIANEGN